MSDDRPRRPRASAPRHHRPVGGRRAADGERRRALSHHLQRRDLQLPRAAARARGQGLRLPHAERHRSAAAPLRRPRTSAWSMRCAACSRSASGTTASRSSSSRATRSASSRSTTPTTAPRSASPRRSRRCSRAGASIPARTWPGSPASISSAACPSRSRSIARCARCRPDRRCASVASAMREPSQYFSVAEEFRKAEAAPSALVPAAMDEQIRAIFSDSMRHHMVSDVPVGVFLSAGIDSSVLAALGAEPSREKLHAMTLGFREYRGTPNDETVLAEKHAAQLGIRHDTRWIERSDFRDAVASLLRRHGPAVDRRRQQLSRRRRPRPHASSRSRFRAWAATSSSAAIRAFATSRASGARCRATARWRKGVARDLRSRPAAFTSPKYAGLLEYGRATPVPTCCAARCSCRGSFPISSAATARRLGWKRCARSRACRRPLAASRTSAASSPRSSSRWYMRNQLLRDADWAGMAHGVEIRVPFVDVTVLRALAPMLAGPHPPTKAQLVKAMRAPAGRRHRHAQKTGFSVPVRDWLRAGPSAPVARAWAARLGARGRADQERTPLPVVRHRRLRRPWRHRALQPRSPAGAVQLSRMRAGDRHSAHDAESSRADARKARLHRHRRRRQAPLPRDGASPVARRSQPRSGGVRAHQSHAACLAREPLPGCAAGALHLRHRRLEAVAEACSPMPSPSESAGSSRSAR